MNEGGGRMRSAQAISKIGFLFGVILVSLPAARGQVETSAFRDAVTLANILSHQQELQSIADANGGTRAAGTPGYDASVAYVRQQLEAAGYTVTLQPFSYIRFEKLGPSLLGQLVPSAVAYVDGTDFEVMTHSEAGDVTAPVTAVDLDLGLGNASTSGCEAADFAGFPVGDIALLQRGACSFSLKAENAAAAGAVGVIIFNQGNTPARTGLFFGTLGEPFSGGIPVVSATYDRGVEWATTLGLTMRMLTNVSRAPVNTVNVLAETANGDPGNIVMVGAHLDSVFAGPGINDNGSGVATSLEIARQIAGVEIQNKVRFAWWGAEEAGLLGAFHYLSLLTPEETGRISDYLELEMLGSPNFVRFVLDTGEPIQTTLEEYYDAAGLPYELIPSNGRTAAFWFEAQQVRTGGIFGGAEGIKTADQALVYGGTAGEQYDPCYHLACDTSDNRSDQGLDQMSDAAAHAVLTLAKPIARGSVTEKGSLLIYSKVDLRWDADGELIQDTFLALTNDQDEDVSVQLYFVNGDEPRDAVFAGNPPQMVADGEPGWNFSDLQVVLTANQPIYWSASTGLPLGAAPFDILDPSNGDGPGRPTADGGRMLRGFVYAWAVDRYGYRIRWNHLSGSATIVNYGDHTAWEYNAWSFQANGPEGCNPHDGGSEEALRLDGFMYDEAFDMLLVDFYASGSDALSSGASSVSLDTDLTLHLVSADLRRNSRGPITTDAKFDIWNENERRFSGTKRCITCWDQTLVSEYDAPNHFLIQSLQTDRGKARVDGVWNTDCDGECVRVSRTFGEPAGLPGYDLPSCSEDAAMLGVVSKVISFAGSPQGVARSGRSVVGMGSQPALIVHDIVDSGGDPPLDLCCGVNCDDGVACTIDSCDPELGCDHALDDSACEDGLFCTGIGSCSPRGCVAVSACPPQFLECGEQVCDEENDMCVIVPNDQDCDESDPCFVSACTPQGSCESSPIPLCGGSVLIVACDDTDVCTINDRQELDSCTRQPCGPCIGEPVAECERTCGGIAGVPCPDGEFCKFDDGLCGLADLAGTCKPIPGACLAVYIPVCGCDGVTYGNECEAEFAGAQIAFVGPCCAGISEPCSVDDDCCQDGAPGSVVCDPIGICSTDD